jgi:hypothetical protein
MMEYFKTPYDIRSNVAKSLSAQQLEQIQNDISAQT